MHSQDEVEGALRLVERGLNDCAIERVTGIPRQTVFDWRHGRVPRFDRARSNCHVCAGVDPQLPEADYAYLLGIYLGDGCISAGPRTYRLRVVLDAIYPGIIDQCAGAMEAVCPGKTAWRGSHGGRRCVEVSMCWNHWPCVFPQHGLGRKHERQIRLVSWQEALVRREPRSLIRGLIHSDGCRIVANDRGVASPRYNFSNLSEGIKRIYCDSLDLLGIPWTRPCAKQIADRRAAVEHLDTFVGPKR